MQDEKRNSGVGGWGAFLGGFGTLLVGLVAYLGYIHPHSGSASGEQSFSVPASATKSINGVMQVVEEGKIIFSERPCSISPTRVTCVLSAVSPGYDHKITIYPYQSTLTDNDGDVFPMKISNTSSFVLDRNKPTPLKVEFDVNKNISRPATVRLFGYIDNRTPLEGAAFEIK